MLLLLTNKFSKYTIYGRKHIYKTFKKVNTHI